MVMAQLKGLIEQISPILVEDKDGKSSISLSKRFFLFDLARKASRAFEDDNYLNFIALLKSYKVLGPFLKGTLEEFYTDRNKPYFRNFFPEHELYVLVKSDIEMLYPRYPHVKMTITKKGLVIYDNYKKRQFNILLLTVHSGTWIPRKIEAKLSLTSEQRYVEEDIGTGELYSRIVLDNAGIWIDNKQSRFAVDFNRPLEKAIYADSSEQWLDVVWKHPLTQAESKELYSSYKEFYFTLSKILDSYSFNMIFDGHSMKDLAERPAMSFGTKYIPSFYMPIVKSMQRKLVKQGYVPVKQNSPFKGGYILRWMAVKFPDRFIFSMEVNKRLYMDSSRKKVVEADVSRISEDLAKTFCT